MKVKVLYFSRSGNTEKVAKAISEAVDQEMESVPPAYPCENEKLLFLGSGCYGGKMDKVMEKFVLTLTPDRVKNVALFGTCSKEHVALAKIREMLTNQGINVLDRQFTCKGKSFIFMNRKNPDEVDLQSAKDFAKKVVETL